MSRLRIPTVVVARGSRWAPALAMIAATALWGASGGVIAGIEVDGVAAASAIELTTGLLLVGLGLAHGHRIGATIAALGPLLPLLAVIEAGNVALYYVALQIAPVGPVMAVHLTAPVILTVVELVSGRQLLSRRRAVSLLLIVAALVMIAVAGRPGTDRQQVVAGLALSLLSAGCIAAFITIVRRVAGKTPATLGAGVQMLCSGLLLSPALLSLRGDGGGLVALLATAVVLFAPACLLYWRALRTLTPVAAGSIQLCEPFFGAAAAAVLYAVRPTGLELLSAVLVLGAVFLELGMPVPDTTAVSSRPEVREPS